MLNENEIQIATDHSKPGGDKTVHAVRKGMEILHVSEDPIVGMIIFKDNLYIATSKHVLRKTESDTFEPLGFKFDGR